MDSKEVGKLIKMARIARGVSCFDVADALGISQQQLSNYETGSQMISDGKIRVLCKFLSIPSLKELEKLLVDNSDPFTGDIRSLYYHMRIFNGLTYKQKSAVNLALKSLVE